MTANGAKPALSSVLKGWLQVPNRKVAQNLRFFKLRGTLNDSPALSSVQLISRHDASSVVGRKLDAIPPESCVAVRATKLVRPRENQRQEQEGIDGQFEYEIQDVDVLNEASRDLPFLPNEESNVDNLVRAQYRQLELRSDGLGTAIRQRARIKNDLRRALEAQNFIEVETPLLFKSTPEGAREFLVPTRKRGQFFALPQSPQQYKQLLMAGGVHRYYQFARCFRDESFRADRQLEFTQLDLEMAFVEQEDVIKAVCKAILSIQPSGIFDHSSEDIPRLRYVEAMTRYGSDKPDLRFDLTVTPIEAANDVVDTIFFDLEDNSHSLSSKTFKDFQASLKPEQVYAIRNKNGIHTIPSAFTDVQSQLPKFPTNSIILLSRRSKDISGGSTSMGKARLLLQAFLERTSLTPLRSPTHFKLCWITDFPLFSPVVDGEGQGGVGASLQSTHHPFTAPHPDDVEFLVTDPARVRGQHYDLVLNGTEIGGGSIRIHDPTQQSRVFDVLQLSQESRSGFEYFLRVLGSGCPPHGGFAFGLDRLVMMVLGRKSIRDVIAFPKTGSGSDLLVGSPSRVTNQQLDEYHLSIK